MADLTALAVPSTLPRLLPLLPAPPARLLEVGCGFGALAAELAGRGFAVTGVDPDEEAVAVARDRRVDVVQGPLDAVGDGGYDAVLFTRSLHHVQDLAATVAHAAGLLAPGGRLVLEEFARERIDAASAAFLYDTVSVLAAFGVAEDREHDVKDPLARWRVDRGEDAEHPLHTGAAMIGALARHGTPGPVAETETLWRMVTSRFTGGDERSVAAAERVREVEVRRIADGTLPPMGFVIAATP